MINIGHTSDVPFAAFDKNGLPPHLHILARDAVHLPNAGTTTADGTSISAMSAALWQFVRVRHGTRPGPHDDGGSPASAAARSTADGKQRTADGGTYA